MKQEKLTATRGSKVNASANVEKIDFANASMDTLKVSAMEHAQLYASRSKKVELTPSDALVKALVNVCVKGFNAGNSWNAIVARLLSYIKTAEPACYYLAMKNKSRFHEVMKSSYPMYVHIQKKRGDEVVDVYLPCTYKMVDSLIDAEKRYGLISLANDEKLIDFSFLYAGCGTKPVKVAVSDVEDLLYKSKHEETVSVVKGAQRITELDENGKAKTHLVERKFYPVIGKGADKGLQRAREGRMMYEAFAHAIATLVWEADEPKQDDKKSDKTSSRRTRNSKK